MHRPTSLATYELVAFPFDDKRLDFMHVLLALLTFPSLLASCPLPFLLLLMWLGWRRLLPLPAVFARQEGKDETSYETEGDISIYFHRCTV